MRTDGHTKPQLVPKFLLQVYVRELHNNLVSDTDDGGIKEEIDAENNISFSDSTLRSILPLQLKKISSRYQVVCGCECYISAKIIHPTLL